jgi:hypothetical protein
MATVSDGSGTSAILIGLDVQLFSGVTHEHFLTNIDDSDQEVSSLFKYLFLPLQRTGTFASIKRMWKKALSNLGPIVSEADNTSIEIHVRVPISHRITTL